MAQEDVGLQHYTEVLWRRKWIILSVLTIVFSISAVWIFMSKTAYKVNSLVAVKSQLYYRQPMLAFAPGTDRPDLSLHGESYVEIINGLPFAEKVANALVAQSIATQPEEVGGSIHAEFKEPDLILIHATHFDKVRAVSFANTAAETFVADTKDSIRAELVSAAQYLQSAMEQAARDLHDNEASITRFKESMGFVNINDEITSLKNTIGAFEKERATIKTQVEVLESHRNEILKLAKLPKEPSEGIPLDDPQVEDLRKLQTMLSDARLRYTDSHPAVQNLQAQIQSVETKMRATLDANGSSLTPERYLALRDDLFKTDAVLLDHKIALESWDKQIAAVRARLVDFPQKQNELEALEARAAEAKQRYNSMRDKLDSINLQKEMVQGNASVVDLAKVPHAATSKSTSLVLAGIVSVMFALGLGFIVEFADTTVRTADEVTRTLGLGFLGAIVRMREPRQVVFAEGKAQHQVAEAYTRIYSNIKFAAVEGPLHSILVTSARKGEGKSTTLVNLACAIAAAGKKVVVVDTDLRNPTLQRIFKTRHVTGLTSVLAGECSLDDALQATPHPGLFILPSGPIPPNPAELIQSAAMKEVIADLEARTDIVIFDTPPTLLVADAMLLAGELDAAIIVTEAGGVTSKEVRHVRDALQLAKARILGVILNKVMETPGAYYANYYSYYRYYQEPETPEKVPEGAMAWLRDSVKSLNSRMGGKT
ncbi:MAG: polysaccharide biosynthesis tyrosine autokinase [Acidobacteria bacterium]|nr:polysaccharide biosynthesis tyrosine autokinase [Acidobacteriota bacterium]